MPIIEDYDDIAKRLRELKTATTPPAKNAEPDEWRDRALEAARVYVENRQKGPMADSLYQKRRQAVRRR